MRQEIDDLMDSTKIVSREVDMVEDTNQCSKKDKYGDMQKQLSLKFNKGPADHPVSGYLL